MFTIDLKIKGKVLEGKAGPMLDKKLDDTMTKVLTFLDGEVSKEIPVGVSGEARAGVVWEKKDRGLYGRVYEEGPAIQYIEVLEKGRRPGQKFPPPDAIRLWLQRTDKGKQYLKKVKTEYFARQTKRLATSEKKGSAAMALLDNRVLDTATFLKSRAIAKYGTKALKMFERVFIKRKAWTVRTFHKAIAEFIRS